MIRSFADKIKGKQEAYQAEQRTLAEQAEQTRIQNEKLIFLEELKEDKARLNQIVADKAYLNEQRHLQEKEKQDAITRGRIEEWAAGEDGRLAEIELNKKIIADAKIRSALRDAVKKPKPAPKRKRSVNEGMPMNAASTWQLTWKSFSMHPDIIDLPMSEKIRLYKLAEQRQPDRTNYYANLNSPANSIGSTGPVYWQDGDVDARDIEFLRVNSSGNPEISEDITWDNSVDVNIPIVVQAGVTLTVLGILTVNAPITNFGTIIVHGVVIETHPISNLPGGSVTIIN